MVTVNFKKIDTTVKLPISEQSNARFTKGNLFGHLNERLRESHATLPKSSTSVHLSYFKNCLKLKDDLMKVHILNSIAFRCRFIFSCDLILIMAQIWVKNLEKLWKTMQFKH